MKPYQSNIINSIVLILFGLWSYLFSETPSISALIPVFIGILLIILNKALKQEKKIQAHLAVILTLLVLAGLIKPLIGSLSRENTAGFLRVLGMMLTSAFALITFIKSFIDARKSQK